ncbi:hypothetical protein ABI59_07885 [Acidobacteria bacterium Mor1]|nr:hypothetical protein ABI59_07885 [Acidobacteria bacterium Mor1]
MSLHRWTVPLACLLLVVFFAAGYVSMRGDSATFDETAHLPAGLSYLERHDFRMNPEHPPLPKMWAALPLRLGIGGAGGEGPHADYDSPAWQGRSVQPGTTMKTAADQWEFGFETINGPLDRVARRDPSGALIPGRTMMLLWGVLLGALVFAWSRELWGDAGALLSLGLYALSPTMLAHARLVTTDTAAALGFTATLWAFWRFTRQPGWGRMVLVGLCLGLALTMKFSALLLLPMLAVLGLLWSSLPKLRHSEAGAHPVKLERFERSQRTSRALICLLLALLLAVPCIWAAYGFRYVAVPDPAYTLDWPAAKAGDGMRAKAIQTALEYKLLPQGWIYGLAYTLGHADTRRAYLNGEVSETGWWSYFPLAFALKTPPALLALLAATLASGVRRGGFRSYDGWCLAAPALIYFVVSMGSNLNIGHRHLTPIYPLIFIGVGSLVWQAAAWKPGRWLLAAALAAYAGSFALASPGYLSYFNLFAGGAQGGARHLLDSNLDWGQDLGRLKQEMDSRGIERVYLLYFGTADPAAYGIEHVPIQMFLPFRSVGFPASGPARLPRTFDGEGPEWIAVSAGMLHGLYLDASDDWAVLALRLGAAHRGHVAAWQREGAGRSFRRYLIDAGVLDEARAGQIEQRTRPAWIEHFRESATPEARAGDSILLYRIPRG